MNKQAYTSGPWHQNGAGRHILRGNTILAEVFPVSMVGDDAEELANARLIAAAPDLLEALKDLMAAFGGVQTHAQQAKWDVAKQAITKATGETQ